MKPAYVYILSNKYRSTLYIGVTNNLRIRLEQHATGFGRKFAAKYNLTDLIYFERCDGKEIAIRREKQLKKYSRERKFELIKSLNPTLRDLKEELMRMD